MDIATIPIITTLTGLVGVIIAGVISFSILKKEKGSEKMVGIADAISEGAMAYLNRQYTTIGIIAVLLFLAIFFALNPETAIAFAAGSFLSALAGYIGMNISVRANVRTANAAMGGLKNALSIAFKGGAVTGLCVAGLSLAGVSILYYLYRDPVLVVGFGFGACLISLFARIGGGIYTKAADVGADLVGKVEAGIPEDDPRNPAVIADNVGDNVGDCAGMGADLFETYAVTVIGAMLLAHLLYPAAISEAYILYPLVLGAVAIIASIIGIFFVRLGRNENIMGALYKGLLISGVLSAIGFYFVSSWIIPGTDGFNLFIATLIGLVIAVSLFVITEYYTSTAFSPVIKLAESAQSGSAVTIINGLALGFQVPLIPVLIICGGILGSYHLGGLYGIAIAAMGMISLTGMIIALDSYGPITDNAGGIAEMANLPEAVRKVTDALDAVGNTTKAVTKAFAIGSAGVAAITLFVAYVQELANVGATNLSFGLQEPLVVVGLLIGGLIPFLFTAKCLKAVGASSFMVVEEVRRQFREIDGIMEGTTRPDYARCVDLVTKSALREFVVPGSIAIASPILVGFILGPVALGGLLIGSIVTGLLLALHMSTAGAAWDNAKKYVEDGNLGGKGSDTHKATVVGDTVGDPYKDTAGPAINPLIKVMNTLAILIAGLIGSGLILL
ncbi:sodium-translocating pyrophosphatase [Methanosarcinales archaeon]|nr:MAG: sodium-translocating pyrophosphatase [Methanosarcinales archaeon]